ncbi:MAG TPA: hypothetical protein VFS43_28135 [Polyangiaceae bacterium]|nr:hypothetical protein [Polyangiaceae bacterium]
MIEDGRKTMTAEELEILRRYSDRSRPFSLMMEAYLSREGL